MSASETLLAQILSELTTLTTSPVQQTAEASPFPPSQANHEQLKSIIASTLTEANTHFHNDWAAHMTAAPTLYSLIGTLLAGLHNGNLLSPHLYPKLQAIEEQLLDWLCELFEHPYGHFVPGGSYANLDALWQAKQSNTKRRTVYSSSAAHYSIAKACKLLELELVTIKTSDNEQIDIDALDAACRKKPPLAIVVTAGTSSQGSFDDLSTCATIAKRYKAWLHVDAAWGGSFKIIPECQYLFEGLALADSVSFDPHKAWAQPKPCSIIFYRHSLNPFVCADSHYLEQRPTHSLPGSYGGESFLPLYFSIIGYGTASLLNDLRHGLQQAKYFSSLLEQHTNWPVYDSPSGIVCFEGPETLNALTREGVISRSQRAKKLIYRAVFIGKQVNANSVFNRLRHYF
jgi:glutamate/tyrosine decarboxylase-like PLP-dependent enzyme